MCPFEVKFPRELGGPAFAARDTLGADVRTLAGNVGTAEDVAMLERARRVGARVQSALAV